MIDWNELFKIRISNPDKSRLKHEVVKLLLVMKLMDKYKKDKNFIRIYTEFDLDNGLICDVYFENARTKTAIAYEIQKEYTPLWLKDRTEKYKDWNVDFMNTSDWIPIDLNKLSDNIEEIYSQLDKYIF
jgi:hypothetical protein